MQWLQSAQWRVAQAVRRRLLSAGPDSLTLSAYRALRSAGPVRLAWRLLVRGDAASWRDTARYAAAGGTFALGAAGRRGPSAPSPAFDDPDFFDVLLQRVAACEPRDEPVAGRILLVNNGLSAGGAERQIVYTLTGLARRGCDVGFLGEYLGVAAGLDFHLNAVRTAGVTARAPRRLRRPVGQAYAPVTREVADGLSRFAPETLLEILEMVDELRDARPAVVHLWQDETAIKHAISALIAGVPRIVLSGRNLNPSHFDYHRSHMRAAYRALARSARVVLSNNSQAGAASYAEWLGLAPDAIKVVHNGVDTQAWPTRPAEERARWRREHGFTPETPVAIGIFRLSAEKRPLLWLDVAASALARDPRLRFVLIGDGPMRGAVDARIRELGLETAVRLLGEIADVGLAVAASDLFLLTSAQEGLPNALLEAQWYGRPCLVTDAGGAREAIKDGVTGALATTDDARCLAERLLALLGDETLRNSARTQGPAFVRHAFGLERMLEETLALYRDA
jgi:glycosyltransferase involved in cell wall biosynthesis